MYRHTFLSCKTLLCVCVCAFTYDSAKAYSNRTIRRQTNLLSSIIYILCTRCTMILFTTRIRRFANAVNAEIHLCGDEVIRPRANIKIFLSTVLSERFQHDKIRVSVSFNIRDKINDAVVAHGSKRRKSMEPIELYRFTDLGLNHSDLELNLSDILSSRANIVGRFTYAFLLL